MVIWMEVGIGVHVFNNLDNDDHFNDFTQDAKDGNRSIVLRFQVIILF